MIIENLWHSKFAIHLENGMDLVTDPFDAGCGFPIVPTRADAVLVSHHHHDHDAVDTLTGSPSVIDTAGIHTLAPDIRVISVPTWHDDRQGTERGPNLIHIIEAEGLRVVHLGDLGHLLTKDQAEAVGRTDILMIPVGGFFTIGPEQAGRIAETLHPTVILPMHFKNRWIPNWPIQTVEPFLELFDRKAEWLSCLRVTADDLDQQPELAVLQPEV